MLKNWRTAALVGMVGLTLLLIPGISEAQRRSGGGGGGGGRGGRTYSSRGYDHDGGRGYYRGYGGWGFGYGYPGYYYGGQPYYYSDYGTYADPRYSYYPDETTQSYYPATSPDQLKNPNDIGFIVRVPDPNAEVWFGNYKTQQGGMVRHFESEPLDPNSTYNYTVRARWNQNGQMMDQTRQINARPGQNQVVDFTTAVQEQVPTLPQRTQ